MPFCESCGAEIKPGKHFCTSCGAPVVKPGASSAPPPVPPQPAPVPPAPVPPVPSSAPKPGLPLDKIIIAVVLVAAVAGIVIFVGLPLMQTPGTDSRPSAGTGQTTPVPSPYVPAATTVPPAPQLTTGSVVNPSQTIVYRSGVPYILVYSQQYELGSVHGAFSYTLTEPPMIVECIMNPQLVTRRKLVDIGTSNERYITATYADPSAWLDLKIRNADTGEVIETIRFSKNYEGMTEQDYTIRAPGNYRFEIAGGLVSPAVRLLVKK